MLEKCSCYKRSCWITRPIGPACSSLGPSARTSDPGAELQDYLTIIEFLSMLGRFCSLGTQSHGLKVAEGSPAKYIEPPLLTVNTSLHGQE